MQIVKLPAGPVPTLATAIPHGEDSSRHIFYELFRSGGMHVTNEVDAGLDEKGVLIPRTIHRYDLYRDNGSWPLPHCRIHRCNHVCDGPTYTQRQTKVKAEGKCASALRKILGG